MTGDLPPVSASFSCSEESACDAEPDAPDASGDRSMSRGDDVSWSSPLRRFRGSSLGRELLAFLALATLIAAVTGGSALARSSTHKSPVKAHKPVPAAVAVPPGFVGVDADGPLFGPETPLNFVAQVKSMVANGVESIRVAFNWAAAQPYQSWSQVPAADQSQYTNVNGQPIDFSGTDEVVQDAAQSGVTVLPTILYTPSWDGQPNPDGVDIPKRTAPYAEYAAALVDRYGPRGNFWSEHPGLRRVPITMWQIWNEPNIPYYWPQPFAKGYVSLLRSAHNAIKNADPQARVVLGALTNFAWKAIGQIYTLPNTRNLFDIVSVNGYTDTPANVILYMRFMRNAMSHFQDGKKPLLATEIGWPSAQGQGVQQHYDFETTEAGQARDISQVLPLLGQQRSALRLIGFYYYTWVGDEDKPHNYVFQFSGLLRFEDNRITAKPALAAFRSGTLALELCRQKGAVATSCVKPVPKPAGKLTHRPARKPAPKPAF